MINKNNSYVEVKVVTWSKDSHGLFDYESKNINVKKCNIENPCNIYRSGDCDVKVIDLSQTPPTPDENTQYLTSIIASQEIMSEQNAPFFLNPNVFDQAVGENSLNHDNYLIVRSLKNKEGTQKGYALEPGDIIKLGRIEYLVLEIKDDKQVRPAPFCPLSELHQVYDDNQLDKDDVKKQCKICLLDDYSDENFFISPCDCKGSCQYVHFLCLKQWVESKIKRKQLGNAISYNWKKSECELCNKAIPKRIKHQQSHYELITIDKPDCPYILLESLSKEKKLAKHLFVITAPQQQSQQQVKDDDSSSVKLGRGHNCEVRISDISVSRTHALIKYQDGKFVIVDNNSKFGTLIKLKRPFPLTSEKVAVQIGRTVITFVIKNQNFLLQQITKQKSKTNK